jgi:hypothetical protein
VLTTEELSHESGTQYRLEMTNKKTDMSTTPPIDLAPAEILEVLHHEKCNSGSFTPRHHCCSQHGASHERNGL